jgi:hypothetical protein
VRAPALVALLIGLLVVPAPAFAGRLIVTGHDADRRCALMDQQCGFLKAAIRYVRETAPNPRKPVLVVDRSPYELEVAIRKAWSDGYGRNYRGPQLVRVAPTALKRGQIDATRYSAVAIASDASCGGCDLDASDAAALAARKRDLAAFLNQGAGIYAGAGGTDAAYYRFAPIPTPGPASTGPFQLTAYGKRIGFTDADVTCCAVANTFAAPDVGSMAVAARTATGVGDTLIADGRVRHGRLLSDTTIPPELGQSIVVQPVSGTVLGHPPDDPHFEHIVGAANLVNGWTLDVTKGRVALTTAADRHGDIQTTEAYEGFFTVLQSPGSPVTDLRLRSGSFDAVCGSGGVDVARASANGKSVRHLWASGKGKFRTVGRFASAAVRGTKWKTDDRCDGTLVTVAKGSVSVFDRTLGRMVVVNAGHSYLARAS